MPFDDFLIDANRSVHKAVRHSIGEPLLHRFVEVALVAFEGKDIVATGIDNLCRNVLLASCRVDRDDCSRHVNVLDQFGNCRDFIRFCLRRQLSETDTVFDGPRTDQEQGSQFVLMVMGTSKCLAIDSDHLLRTRYRNRRAFLCRFGQSLNPRLKASLKCLRLEQREQPSNRIM